MTFVSSTVGVSSQGRSRPSTACGITPAVVADNPYQYAYHDYSEQHALGDMQPEALVISRRILQGSAYSSAFVEAALRRTASCSVSTSAVKSMDTNARRQVPCTHLLTWCQHGPQQQSSFQSPHCQWLPATASPHQPAQFLNAKTSSCVETRLYCPQPFLNLAFHYRISVSELKYMFQD